MSADILLILLEEKPIGLDRVITLEIGYLILYEDVCFVKMDINAFPSFLIQCGQN